MVVLEWMLSEHANKIMYILSNEGRSIKIRVHGQATEFFVLVYKKESIIVQ